LTSSVLRIVIDNPSRRNALDDSGIAAFIAALGQAQVDDRVRAVLVSGAGANFCSGFDIVARNAGNGPRPRVGSIQRRLPTQANQLIPLLCEVQLPVVASVHGYAVGIGLQLLLACDFVVASTTAVLWEPFLQRGMTPDAGASWLLPRAVGPLRARQLLLLGTRLTGAEALDWGIVHEAVDDDRVDATAQQLVEQLATGPTAALGLTRWLVNSAPDRTLKEQLAAEAFAMELGSRSPDFREGLSAFGEKRPPEFTGG
jgi:2-(1,2-epoxy-1,2-dihydrophenyl)acetyl-CoA isomerase